MLNGAFLRSLSARGLMAGMILLGVIACGKPALETRTDATIFAWLQCHDCMHNQASRVIALGDTAVPRLRQILIQGPPRSHDSAYVASLQRLAQRSPAVTPVVIERQRKLFGAVYRQRAVSALAGIGNTSARGALCLARATRSIDLATRVAIDSSLTLMNAACP